MLKKYNMHPGFTTLEQAIQELKDLEEANKIPGNIPPEVYEATKEELESEVERIRINDNRRD
jgi:hypothetical protein